MESTDTPPQHFRGHSSGESVVSKRYDKSPSSDQTVIHDAEFSAKWIANCAAERSRRIERGSLLFLPFIRLLLKTTAIHTGGTVGAHTRFRGKCITIAGLLCPPSVTIKVCLVFFHENAPRRALLPPR